MCIELSKQAHWRLEPHKESHSPCLTVLAVLLNANIVTAAQLVLLLLAHIVATLLSLASRGRWPSITIALLPGLGLKWQCDQLCVESQPFFALPSKKLGAYNADSHIHIWSPEAGYCSLLSVFSEPLVQSDTKWYSSQWNLLPNLPGNKLITIQN